MRHQKPTILPRISQFGYEPVGGSSTQSKWRAFWTWKKVLATGSILLLMLWLFNSSNRNSLSEAETLPDFEFDRPVNTIPPHKPHPKPTHQEPEKQGPHLTFETDPNPSSTTHCTEPISLSKPLVQWALMIDAGSTGSRIHIYKFNNCGASPIYEYEVFKMIRPGLSSFATNPEGAAQSLDPLMDAAMATVPANLRACTPVAVKATAGLRLLGAKQSESILNAVALRLTEKYPFKVVEKEGVVIMDGKDEGVFAWITANYLLDTIRRGSTNPPYAVLDLGGASTQIVFEPNFEDESGRLEDGEHKYDLTFGGKDHVLYQHSYLGYGLMRARASVHRLVEFMASYGAKIEENKEVANPCLSKGTKKRIEIDIGREDTPIFKNYTMTGADIGGFESCNRVLEMVMAKDAVCQVKPCSFNGVYQPSLMQSFAKGPILLLSYFYDRLAPLLPAGTSKLSISRIGELAKEVCEGRSQWEKNRLWASDEAIMEELEDRPEYCLDLSFMHALLRLGYEFEDEREVRIEKKVDGTELGWCLGATISLLDGHLECRA